MTKCRTRPYVAHQNKGRTHYLEEGLPGVQLFVVHIVDGHFEDIIHFLTT